MAKKLGLIGVPTSMGAFAPGQEKGPRALRDADLPGRLLRAGVGVAHYGDGSRVRRWRPDKDNRRAQNLPDVVEVAEEIAQRVGAAHAAGHLPLVVGGDCTIELGTVAGLLSSGEDLGLIYFDVHPDLNVPDSVAETLAEALHAARRTSQKRAKRISALKSQVAELKDARNKDQRLLHYLLSDAFERYGPWVTGVRIDGKVYGRATRHSSPRLGEFFEAFPEASRGRVLEPGSQEGAMTVEIAKKAREVVGLEGRQENAERAEFLKGLFGAENVDFHVTDLEEDDLSSYGEFDAVFC